MTATAWGIGMVRTAGIFQDGLLAYPDKSRLGCKRNEDPVVGVQNNKRNLALGWDAIILELKQFLYFE